MMSLAPETGNRLQQLGKYQLIRKLAVGGMAEVYLAKAAGPMGFEKTLVLKRILPSLAADPRFVELFLAEAKLAARLNHPHIAQIFDLGEAEGSFFIAMEYVDGPNLRSLIRRSVERASPLPVGFCAKIVSYACEALAYAHDFVDPQTGMPLSLIHRDLSPDNVLLSRNGAVKVVDFGIAKAGGQEHQTQVGLLRGKISYMPPEQIQGKEIDRRADIYALGVVLYELITGCKPFDARTEVTITQAILYEQVIPVAARRSDIADAIGRILQRALAKDPDARYRTCRQFQAELERFIVGSGESVGPYELAKLVARLSSPAIAFTERPTPKDGVPVFAAPISATPSNPSVRFAGPGSSMGGGAASSRPTKRSAAHRAAALVGIVAGTLLVIMGGGYVVFQTQGQEEPQRGPGIRAFASRSRAARQGFPHMETTAELAAQPQSSLEGLASLEVESVPPGQVRVNGKLLGSSPLKIHDQRPGEVRVEVFNPTLGFSKEQVFRVAAGENGTRRIEVSRAELEIRVLPYATVLLDGQMLGRTPLPPMQVYEGKHRVLLVNRELGKEISVDYTVKPGQLNLFQYNFAQ